MTEKWREVEPRTRDEHEEAMVTDAYRCGTMMDNTKAMRWLVEFGRGWVKTGTIPTDHWANEELYWEANSVLGYMQVKHDGGSNDMDYDYDLVRITRKGLKLIKEGKYE